MGEIYEKDDDCLLGKLRNCISY